VIIENTILRSTLKDSIRFASVTIYNKALMKKLNSIYILEFSYIGSLC